MVRLTRVADEGDLPKHGAPPPERRREWKPVEEEPAALRRREAWPADPQLKSLLDVVRAERWAVFLRRRAAGYLEQASLPADQERTLSQFEQPRPKRAHYRWRLWRRSPSEDSGDR